MKRDITRIMIRHLGELDAILAQYGVTGRIGLLEAAEDNLVFEKAILMTVGYIGELSNKVDDSIMQAHPEISWRRLSRSRNIIFHDYDIVDMEIIASVIFKDIAKLRLIFEETQP